MPADKRRVRAPLIEELTSGEKEKGKRVGVGRWTKAGGAVVARSHRGDNKVRRRVVVHGSNRRTAYQGAERRQTPRAAHPDHAERCWLALR